MARILPATVEVGPHTYRLMRTEEADSDKQWGFTSCQRRIIGFGLLCNPREMPTTLMHELIHAVGDAYGVRLEEGQVEALSNGLVQALTSLGLLPRELELRRGS